LQDFAENLAEIMNSTLEPLDNEKRTWQSRDFEQQGRTSFLKGVHLAYEEDKEVIKGVSFLLQQVSDCLVELSGSGKRRIAWPAATFLKSWFGEITLDGYDVTDYYPESFRSD